jgi:hypothetical protein
LWEQFDHYCNVDHSHCTHAPDYKPKSWKWVIAVSDVAALKKEFDAIVAQSEAYCKNYSSNICEAFANSRTKWTDKRKNMRVGFSLGTYCAALSLCERKEDIKHWKQKLLQLADIPVSSNNVTTWEKDLDRQKHKIQR